MKRFRPALVPTLAMLAGLAVLLALGTWQTRRYFQQSALVERYHVQHDLRPPVRTAAELTVADRASELQFRRVELTGKLAGEHLQWLTGRYMFSERGYGVLVPLLVDDVKVLVHLGWVPDAKAKDYAATLRTQTTSSVRGRLHVNTDARIPIVAPAGEHLGRPTWRAPDPRSVAMKLPGLDPQLLVMAGEQAVGKPVDPKKVPLDGYAYPVRPLPAKNVEYALTWYGLAVTLVAVWVALSLRKDAAA
jgi:surfeit locus 1 family protein